MSTLNLRARDAAALDPALRLRALHTPQPRTRVAPVHVLALLDMVSAVLGACLVLVLAQIRDLASVAVLSGLVVLWPALMHESRAGHADLFSHRRIRTGHLVLGMLRAGIVLGCAVWLTQAPLLARELVAVVVLTAAATMACRALWQLTQPPRRVLIVGHRDRAEVWSDLLTTLHARDVVMVDRTPPEVEQVVVRASRDDIEDVVVLGCGHLSQADLRRLGWQLEQRHQNLHVATDLLGVGSHRAHVESSGTVSLIGVRPSETDGVRRVLWNTGGRLLAALLLLVSSPLWILASLAIRMSSPGPVLFRQERIGRHGRRFEMIKFRTMTEDAAHPPEAANHIPGQVLFKARQDPRVTPLGAWLRRYSVDELPQLLNVLRGDMALIGPRPALAPEVARYTDDMHRRLAVRPGMTGLWQVSGRSDLDWDQTMRLDLEYVDNWSASLDLRILLRTVPAVLGHRGAY